MDALTSADQSYGEKDFFFQEKKNVHTALHTLDQLGNFKVFEQNFGIRFIFHGIESTIEQYLQKTADNTF